LRFAIGAFDTLIGKFVVYGLTADYSAAQTWTWDGGWKQVTGSESPTARYATAMAYDAKSGRVILFGGKTTLSYLDDVWAFDGARWTRLNPATRPSARRHHLMASVSQGVLLVGGDGDRANFADAWTWDGTDWQSVPTLHAPTQYSPAGMTSRNGQAVLVTFASKDGEALTYTLSQNDWGRA
jgi:Tfp pilus assembly protein PilV